MEFRVDAYENTGLFPRVRADDYPFFFDTAEDAAWAVSQPNRLIAIFLVEADTAQAAADKVFEIGNAPWEPADLLGKRWDHKRYRSQSSGDNVVVHTPDGPVGYTVMYMGFKTFCPSDLNGLDRSTPV